MVDKKDPIQNIKDIDSNIAPRARNRTVMLTPEMTGQLRSRMLHDNPQPEEEEQIRVRTSTPSAPQTSQPTISFRPQQIIQPSLLTPEAQPTRSPESPKPIISSPLQQASEQGPIIQPLHQFHQYQQHHQQEQPQRPPQPLPSQLSQHSSPQSGAFSSMKKNAIITDLEEELNPSDGIFWSRKTPIVGFLVSFDKDSNGDVFELRQGRVIITCEKASHGDYLVIHHDSISPMHAILRITASGEVQVLDQLSEFGTKIKKFGVEEVTDLSGERSPVTHGDILYFGERSFHVSMIAKSK